MPRTIAKPSINKTTLVRLARLGSEAAKLPYFNAEKALIKHNKISSNWFPFFATKPIVEPHEVCSSPLYRDYMYLEDHKQYIKKFMDEVYTTMVALQGDIDGDKNRAIQNSIISNKIYFLYEDILSKNKGEHRIQCHFYRELHKKFGKPDVNDNMDTLTKASLIVLGLGITLLSVTIAGSFMGASFATLSPFLLCAYGLFFASLAINGIKNVINVSHAEKDSFVLPSNVVRPLNVVPPVAILNSEDVNFGSSITVGQPVRMM